MKKLNASALVIILSFVFVNNDILSQEKIKAKFDTNAWDITAKKHEFKKYKGKKALYIENGTALLKDARFKNGIIDYDVNFESGRKFLSFFYRIQDSKNYEDFYLRAHQSGNPDAMQYTPVFNGNAGWQLYYGNGHSTAYTYNFGEWIHVRLIVADDKMDVFINDMSQAVLHVNDLKHKTTEGGIGLRTLMGGAYYANLSYQSIEKPKLLSKIEKLPEVEKGTIKEWHISSAFNKTKLSSIHNLKNFEFKKETKWTKLPVEYTGTANLSKISELSKETNTVLVKAVIVSSTNQIKQLDFGYSDEASVFVNNKIIYTGHRKFRSRDYRYLGTIGYFDSIFLNLKKGKNEIIFAVTENFGGWGLKAKLENMEGVKVEY